MAGIRDSHIEGEDGNYHVRFEYDDEGDPMSSNAWAASRFVFYMYAQYAEEYGLPEIISPDLPTSD